MDKETVYKCYIGYLVNLFSKYIQTNETQFLIEIQKILYSENLIFSMSFSFSITSELKVACLKMVLNL